MIINTFAETTFVITPLANISTSNKIKLRIANLEIHKMELF